MDEHNSRSGRVYDTSYWGCNEMTASHQLYIRYLKVMLKQSVD